MCVNAADAAGYLRGQCVSAALAHNTCIVDQDVDTARSQLGDLFHGSLDVDKREREVRRQSNDTFPFELSLYLDGCGVDRIELEAVDALVID